MLKRVVVLRVFACVGDLWFMSLGGLLGSGVYCDPTLGLGPLMDGLGTCSRRPPQYGLFPTTCFNLSGTGVLDTHDHGFARG